MWNITLLWPFCCPLLSWLYFFLGLAPKSNPWTDFNRLWLKWRVATEGCACWRFGWQTTILRGLTPNSPKGAWLGIFYQRNWQNYKTAIFSARKIGSTPNFDRVIELHSWLRGWSRITKFKFKMTNGRHIAQCWKRYNSPNTMNRYGWNLGDHIPPRSPHVRQDAVAMATANSRCLATAHWTLSSHLRL